MPTFGSTEAKVVDWPRDPSDRARTSPRSAEDSTRVLKVGVRYGSYMVTPDM